MDYSQLSDFEINAAVFEVLYGGSPDCKEGDNGEMLLVSFGADVVGGDIVEVEVVRGSFNPCDNWSEAGPIIDSNRIGVMPSAMKAKELWVSTSGKGSYAYHEKPLRAAMIVFLQMQDTKNA